MWPIIVAILPITYFSPTSAAQEIKIGFIKRRKTLINKAIYSFSRITTTITSNTTHPTKL